MEPGYCTVAVDFSLYYWSMATLVRSLYCSQMSRGTDYLPTIASGKSALTNSPSAVLQLTQVHGWHGVPNGRRLRYLLSAVAYRVESESHMYYIQ